MTLPPRIADEPPAPSSDGNGRTRRANYQNRSVVLATTVILITVSLGLALVEVLLRIASRHDFVTLSGSVDMLSKYRADWHHDRPPNLNPFDDWRQPGGCADPTITIVLAGDSWVREPEFGLGLIAGLSDLSFCQKNIGHPPCIRVVNTGTGSFSPTPITIRLSRLLKELTPDIIIVNIDETDLMDEWIRYRHTAVVSPEGIPLAAPPFLSDLPEILYHITLEVMDDVPLYTVRALQRALVHGIFLPQVREVLRRRGHLAAYDTILAPQQSRDAEIVFADAIALFESRLKALVQSIQRTQPAAQIIFTHHPHYLHVGGGTNRYHFSVSSVIRSALSESNVQLYFAELEMEAVHGSRYSAEEVFDWPQDPFSHLTPNARRSYGRWVAKKVKEGWACPDRNARARGGERGLRECQ